jgi:hypothetical protein
MTQVQSALDVLRWALSFHRRHLVLVTALSLVPGGERVAVQVWDLSGVAAVAAELVTEVARLVLIVVVARMAILAEPAPPGGRWHSVRVFLGERRPSLFVQWGLLMAISAVTVLIPNLVLSRWIPDGAERWYWAGLLAVKNVTIIPFTMIWMVGAVRQAMRHTGAGRRPLETPPVPVRSGG